MKKPLCFTLGSLAFSLGFVGIFLPLLPTTPFMILAAGCFAKSSPRFHQALINNRWIGADLQRWEREGTMSRETKKRATWVILATFSLSIAVLYDRHWLQLMLLALAAILLFFLWRVPENRSSVNS